MSSAAVDNPIGAALASQSPQISASNLPHSPVGKSGPIFGELTAVNWRKWASSRLQQSAQPQQPSNGTTDRAEQNFAARHPARLPHEPLVADPSTHVPSEDASAVVDPLTPLPREARGRDDADDHGSFHNDRSAAHLSKRTGQALSGCSATWQPLLPGLPDDVAELCLIRLPRTLIQQCRQVNRAWKVFLDSPRCLRLRTAANRLEPWLFVRAVGQPRKHFEWHAFAESAGWQKIPHPRGAGQWEASGVGCVGLDRCLYMIGGTGSDRKKPLADTFRYDPQTARWTQLANLIAPRSFFASWAARGKIIVAGGNAAELEEIKSAEVYQPETDTWQSIPPLPLAFSSFGAASFGGTLFLTEGGEDSQALFLLPRY
ncbi:unnamed protein product [Closterium sp. Yama58-4]|nr:unnamed protein product [Closterium sp. Yama58-4]